MNAITRPSEERAPGDPPRYRAICDVLAAEIATGVVAVGAHLSTEQELRGRFGASRHTVREALRLLQERGLIQRRQGAGSRVVSREPRDGAANSINSISDLMQYAASTYMEVLAVERLLLPAEEVARLFRREGHGPFTRIAALRRTGADAPPIAYTEVYLPDRYAGIAEDVGLSPTAVYRLVEERYGIALSAVLQTVEATLADANLASRLGVEPGSAILAVARRYEAAGEGVVEVALNYHPAARFRHEIRLSNISSAGEAAR